MTSRVALGVILLGGGVAWLLAETGVLDLSYGTWVGVALVAIGLAIALTPGGHGVLATLGILVLLAGLPALVVDDVNGGVGDATSSPSRPADIERFEHGIGKYTIDLTAPGLAADPALDVEAELGIGELLILVPERADVVVDAHVGLGNIDALGEQADGVDADLSQTFPGAGKRRISLDLSNGIGDIRVERR
jgi:hypothetical protein